MPNLVIKPTSGAGNKLIFQDQNGDAILTSTDSGGGIASLKLAPTGTAPAATAGNMYFDTTSNKLLIYNGTAWTEVDVPETSSTGSGGLITEYSTYRVHTFLYEHSHTNFVLYTAKTCDILMVAGGGGGANYNTTVGYAGGDEGENTTFNGLLAHGGGGGGYGVGKAGGSGGGGGYQAGGGAGAGTSGQGNAGGAGHGSQAGGGGGGAGATGTAAGSSDPGEGGNGAQNSWRTGSNIYYAGGGAGGTTIAQGTTVQGGLGGGGDSYSTGGTVNIDGENGTDGLGGGGGCGEYWGSGEGGGGAGGMLETSGLAMSAGTYKVIVGAGGPGSGNKASITNWTTNPANLGGDNQGGDGGSGIVVIRYTA